MNRRSRFDPATEHVDPTIKPCHPVRVRDFLDGVVTRDEEIYFGVGLAPARSKIPATFPRK